MIGALRSNIARLHRPRRADPEYTIDAKLAVFAIRPYGVRPHQTPYLNETASRLFKLGAPSPQSADGLIARHAELAVAELVRANDHVGPCAGIRPAVFSKHSRFRIGHIPASVSCRREALFLIFVQVTSHDSPRFIVLEFEHKRPKQVLQCTLRQPVLRNMLVKLRLKNALLVLFNNKANFSSASAFHRACGSHTSCNPADLIAPQDLAASSVALPTRRRGSQRAIAVSRPHPTATAKQ